ncbi:SAF domain-containing protein [Cellulomonas sp. KH9]|uniref:SAF domain-containing protein n=1 Tax=Cellulomonas sp. KH9 TaxID=1855324 RepID=UPI0015A72717|nr:SAF domain-containing protein [Cellulomonas sp. KH9]
MNTGPATDAGVDRRARGARPAAPARGDRLPPPPRERRPLLAAFAVLLIVGGAAVAGLLALRADARVPVLVAARDIGAGEEITADALGTTPVASEGTLLVPASQQELVVGQYARRPVSAGQLLDTTMLTRLSTLTDGKVAVGAALAAGRVPASGLQPGDIVQLVRVGDGQGEVVVPDALVSSTVQAGDSAGTSVTTATLIVDEDAGASVAGLAAESRLAVVLVERGTPVTAEEG